MPGLGDDSVARLSEFELSFEAMLRFVDVEDFEKKNK